MKNECDNSPEDMDSIPHQRWAEFQNSMIKQFGRVAKSSRVQ